MLTDTLFLAQPGVLRKLLQHCLTLELAGLGNSARMQTGTPRSRALSEDSGRFVFDQESATPHHAGQVGPGGPNEALLADLPLQQRLSKSLHGFTIRMLLLSTLVLQLVNVLFLQLYRDGAGLLGDKVDRTALSVVCIIQSMQLVATAVGTFLVWNNVWRITMATACALYAAFLFTFAGWYVLCCVAGSAQLAFAPEIVRESDHNDSAWKFCATVLYYSIEVQTLTGLGEIWSNAVATQLISALQMMAGVLFNVWILGQTMHRLQGKRRKGPRHGCLHFISRLRVLKKLRKWTRKYLLLIVALLQLLVFAVLVVYGAHVNLREESLQETWVIDAGILATTLQILVIVVTSSKFVVRKTHRVSISFVAQTYFACVLTFSGLYALLFLSSTSRRAFWVPLPDWQKGSGGHSHVTETDVPVLTLLVQLLWFSVSTLTSTGFGTTAPLTLTARAAVAVQMQLQVVFTVLILGYGLSAVRKRKHIEGLAAAAAAQGSDAPLAAAAAATAVTDVAAVLSGASDTEGNTSATSSAAALHSRHTYTARAGHPPLTALQAMAGGIAASPAQGPMGTPGGSTRALQRSLLKSGHTDDGRRYYHTSSDSSDEEGHAGGAPGSALNLPLLEHAASAVLGARSTSAREAPRRHSRTRRVASPGRPPLLPLMGAGVDIATLPPAAAEQGGGWAGTHRMATSQLSTNSSPLLRGFQPPPQ